MYVVPRYEALQYDGSNIAAFQGFVPGLTVSPYGESSMLCQKDGGETVIDPGDYVIRRETSIYYVKEADFATWWGTA